MKNTFLAGVIALALMMTPAFAVFSGGKTETFGNGLNGWPKSGSAGDKLAASEKTASCEHNRMWTYFVASSENYALNFGHRRSTLEKDLSAGLAGRSGNKGTLRDVTTHSSTGVFVGGAADWSGGGSNETSHGRSILAVNIKIDNDTSLTQIRCIPAPGAILLSSLGAGLVGWLRSRRVL